VPETITSAERRRWQRLPVPVPMFIRGVDEQGKDFLEFSTAINISAGGALLVTRRYLPSSSKISVEIPPPALPRHMSAQSAKARNIKAKVISVTLSDRYHLCGLAFSRPLTIH
jgi:PilZ domain